MKANTPGFVITPEMVEQAEHEKARLEHDIADAQRKLGLISNFLRLAAAYKDDSEAEAIEKTEESEIAPVEGEEVDPSNMMGMIAKIANESTRPLTKTELKAKLIETGTEESRLGSYFYVAVDRLKKKDRICVLDDGRVWRAPPKN